MTNDKQSEDPDWGLVSFLAASPNRQTVLAHLDVRPFTPSQLAELTELNMAHVSRALSQLREQGVVELLVDEDRKKGRIYGVTETGQTLIEERRSVIFHQLNGGPAGVFTRSNSQDSDSS